MFFGSALDEGPARLRPLMTISLRRHQGPAIGIQGPTNIERGSTSFSRAEFPSRQRNPRAVLLEINQRPRRRTSGRDTGRGRIDIMAPGNYLLHPQISHYPEIERQAQVAGAYIDN